MNYTIFDNKNDSIKLISKPFSDVEIESDSSDFHLKLLPEKFRNPAMVIDDAGRLFERITIKGKSVLVRTLVKGQHNLYLKYQDEKTGKYVFRSKSNAENAVNYLVTNQKDSLLLSKNDKIENNVFKEDEKYKGKLQYLSRDFPELFNEIKSIKFDNSQIQSLIYKLNSNYTNTPNTKLLVTLHKDFFPLG